MFDPSGIVEPYPEGFLSLSIPDEAITRWQHLVDLLAKIIEVPSVLILQAHAGQLEVLVASNTEGNPYLSGEMVEVHQEIVGVPNALKDADRKCNPLIKTGMTSYLGFPLIWPDGEPFGIICVMDRQEHVYTNPQQDLLLEFSKTINDRLRQLTEDAARESVLSLLQQDIPDLVAEERANFSKPNDELESDANVSALLKNKALEQILQSFCETFGVASAVIDLDGVVIVQANWQRVCTEFHRMNEQTCKRCLESDTYLANQLTEGNEYALYRCRNGMTDAASPIFINGKHVANAFIGQFHHMLPDLDFFRVQAKEFGFDEVEYLAAVKEAAVISDEQLPQLLRFITHVAKLSANMALEKVRSQRALRRLERGRKSLEAQQRAALCLMDEMRQTEQALKESEQKWHAILDHHRQLSGLVAPDGRLLVANRTSLLFANVDESQVIGSYFWDGPWWAPEQRILLKDAIKRALGGKIVRFETTHLAEDGSVRNIDFSLSPVFGDDGDIIYLVPEGLDITDRKEAEEARKKLEGQLRHAQKMEAVGQLAGGVAHDFNNILQVIMGYGELLSEPSGSENATEFQTEAIEEIMKSARRASILVRQLLAFSRKQVLNRVALNLNEILDEDVGMIRRLIGEHITLTLNLASNLRMIDADRSQLEQIIINLCINARDAMPDGGQITIQTENVYFDDSDCQKAEGPAVPGHYVMLIVQDTGCGMDDETRKHIFEPFFTTKSVGKGTGLGLASVYGIVQQHEGRIDVCGGSDAGTEFKIWFPSDEVNSSVADLVEKHEELPGGSETILLAEDDEMIRNLAVRILERAGYTVLPAQDGEEAIRIFDEKDGLIDMALLDMIMPKQNGSAVCGHIRKHHPEMRVLFCSGYSNDVIQNGIGSDAGVQLIQKPFLQAQLLQAIRRVLDE